MGTLVDVSSKMKKKVGGDPSKMKKCHSRTLCLNKREHNEKKKKKKANMKGKEEGE